jgi:hypothetical protein
MHTVRARQHRRGPLAIATVSPRASTQRLERRRRRVHTIARNSIATKRSPASAGCRTPAGAAFARKKIYGVKTLFAAIVSVSLCACSNSSNTPSFSPGSQPAPAVRRAAATAYVAEVCERKNGKCPVPNGLVETLDGTTITDGIFDPWSLAFDASGNLYAGSQNGTSPSGFVTEYASGSVSPSRTIDLSWTPHGLAVDASNNLYVVGNAKAGCCGFQGFGDVYGPNGKKRLQKLTGVASFPGRPAIDAQGNLYVPNFSTFPGDVVVYAPGAKKPMRAIQDGIGFPKVLAFDSAGNLYVLNNTFQFGSNVTVYAAGTGTLIRTISKGMKSAYTMALDSHDNVYVANDAARGVTNQVFVYAAGTTSLMRSIVNGVKYPVGLAFDASGNLYVANAPKRGATVTVYAPGASDPSNTYKLKESPTAIAVPPGE